MITTRPFDPAEVAATIKTAKRAEIYGLTEPGQDLFLGSLGFASDNLIPNPPMDIVDWCREYVVLPTSVSERSGPLVFSPIQSAIIRLTQEHGLHQVTFQKPPRWGSSLKAAAIILYNAFHEGRSIIYYERSESASQDLHDKVLLPIIENSPRLRQLMRPKTKAGVQDSWSDIILTNGAAIQLRSASNNGHFRAIKGNPILADEVSSKEWRDRSKNSEGSKLTLLRARLQQFAAPMLYAGSTPTKLGECVISQEYARSDMRIYVMPCPRCRDEIVFEPNVQSVTDREQRRGPGLRYCRDENGKVADAWYECACGGLIEESEKLAMIRAGRFKITNPLGEDGHAGVYAWAIHSTDPQSAWKLIGKAHVSAVENPGAIMNC